MKSLLIGVLVCIASFYGMNERVYAQQMEWSTDRPGLDYMNFVPKRADPALCQRDCQADERCKAWTYVQPYTTQGSQPRCWLKKGVPPPRKDPCCVSGVKTERDTNTYNSPRIGKYRLDWCRYPGKDCGKPAADAFCRKMGYKRAADFAIDRDIGRSGATYIIGNKAKCKGDCDGFTFIRCE